MVEKMTAVWLIILTILVCASVPGVLIWLTSGPPPNMLLGLSPAENLLAYPTLH